VFERLQHALLGRGIHDHLRPWRVVDVAMLLAVVGIRLVEGHWYPRAWSARTMSALLVARIPKGITLAETTTLSKESAALLEKIVKQYALGKGPAAASSVLQADSAAARGPRTGWPQNDR
jgi:hypothetical protein